MHPRLLVVLGVALLVRVVAAATPGFADDRILFAQWAQLLAAHGPLAIYAPAVTPAVDYSPGFLYVLWAIGAIHALLGGGEIAWRVLLEVVPIAGDLAIIVLLYGLARKIGSDGHAIIVAWVLALAPPLWFDSGLWGQADSIPIALAIVALGATQRGREDAAWPLLAMAVIVKPLVVVLGPLVAAIRGPGSSLARAIVGIAVSVFLAYVMTLPFTIERTPLGVLRFLLSRYVAGAGKAPYVTAGGFSIYPIFTNFFTSDATRFGPFSYHAWGVGLVIVVLAWIVVPLVRAPALRGDEAARTRAIFGAASLSLLVLFLFATRMHERYLLPALVIGAPLALDDRPTAWALAYLALSFTVNCVYSLAYFTGGAHHPLTVIVGRVFCALNVAALAVLSQRYYRRLRTT
jgi:Gpi18-like mannosyltransferase